MSDKKEAFDIRVHPIEYDLAHEPKTKEKKRPRKAISKKKISLYKTEICKSFETSSFCTYGDKCQFAHSLEELRDIERHPRYKTELCKTYTTHGACSYGKRCCFIHAGSNSDKDTDLQDARNMPGDWKAPGVVDSDVEMNKIAPEQAAKSVETLTEEENEKLRILSKFKLKPFSLKKSAKSQFSSISKSYIDPKNSSSVTWLKPHQCFVFVDAGCKTSSVKPLGKAPGGISITKGN